MSDVQQLVPEIVWRTPGASSNTLDPHLVRLLEAIRREGTLRAAVTAVGLSYRTAWGLLAQAADTLGAPLAELERGRGARVAPLGVALLERDAAARALLKKGRIAVALPLPREAGPPRRATMRLRVVASHDLALASLCEAWRKVRILDIDLQVRGSVESLDALRRGETTLAGFHLAVGGLGNEEIERRLDRRRDVCLRFAHRQQGLIVPRGNPRGLRALADVARRGLRFVNRQRGSGTRLLVDQLLRAQQVDPAALRGYADEEFTHLAVAATVAAGRADVGLGLEAAARQFRLGFVPLVEERYLFACRRSALKQPGVQAFRGALARRSTRRAVAQIAGYSPDGPGQIIEPGTLVGSTPGASPRG